MPGKSDDLKTRLSRLRQINLTVTGRKSGREITIPVWFVFDEGALYLLPVQGSETQWYKNVLKNPTIKVDARGEQTEMRVRHVSGVAEAKAVVEKFRDKYGAADVKKYYSKFDAAVVAKVA